MVASKAATMMLYRIHRVKRGIEEEEEEEEEEQKALAK